MRRNKNTQACQVPSPRPGGFQPPLAPTPSARQVDDSTAAEPRPGVRPPQPDAVLGTGTAESGAMRVFRTEHTLAQRKTSSSSHFPLKRSEVKVAQSCPILCDTMDYTVHGILQDRMLEWVAFPFSSRSSQPRDRIQVSHKTGGFFTS